MIQPTDTNTKSLAYNLFKGMHEDNLEYTYRGVFTTSITDTILSLAETNLDNAEETRKIKKRVYFIMVEGLQNITRHQTEHLGDEISEYPGLFALQRMGDTGYSVTTGNLIEQKDISLLKAQIDKINSLDKAELKQYSLEILDQGDISTKGGAGLGLIEIARKSGNKMHYAFKKINDDFAFFYMNTRITANSDAHIDDENPLDNIMELHKILEDQNILLNFSGIFNQETLINLLSIIENQLKGTYILKMKVFNLMVEMLQNIVKHADNYNYKGEKGKHAIFYISETDDEIIFTSGNYIKNEKIKNFRNRLEKINTLEKDKLNDFYNQTLFNFDKNNDMHTGLGLLDIKMKCKTPYVFDFYKINDEFSFYSLQIHVKKMKTSISPYIIEKSTDTPEINLDSNTGIFKIAGRSIPENAVSFYSPIISWLSKYKKNPCAVTEVIFDWEYYNTATDKQVAKIMLQLEELAEKGKTIVKWHYMEGDHSMMSHGMRFKELLKLDIEMIEDPCEDEEDDDF